VVPFRVHKDEKRRRVIKYLTASAFYFLLIGADSFVDET